MRRKKEITIIGGGIAGLATAYYLQKKFGNEITYTVVEKTAVFGGKISTTRTDKFIIEGGPESFVTRKREAYDLCIELGLEDRLVGTEGSGKNYILHDGRPAAVPTNPIALARTPLLSRKGKIRLFKEPFVPPRMETSDETFSAFISRRLGAEAADHLAAPALRSIYLADIEKLSTAVSFGRFTELEQKYGSITKGMFGSMKEKKAARKASGEEKPKKLAPFMTLRSGLLELVETLTGRLTGDLLLETAVTAIKKMEDGRYQLQLNNGNSLDSDIVIMAIPTFAMADLIAPHDGDMGELLHNMPYNAVATVTMAFDAEDVERPFDGFGVVVPKEAGIPLLACEGMSVKFSHRNPEDQIVLRGFVGGKGHEHLIALPDDALAALVKKQLDSIFGLKGEPTISKIYRWQPAAPQYAVGHLETITAVEAKLAALLPNIYITGSGTRGMGIPDCIRLAQETVSKIE